jgi:hypothetical protein
MAKCVSTQLEVLYEATALIRLSLIELNYLQDATIGIRHLSQVRGVFLDAARALMFELEQKELKGKRKGRVTQA